MFAGPSKHLVLKMAQGVANMAMPIHMLPTLDAGNRAKTVEKMKAENVLTTMDGLVVTAALVVAKQRMGWLRKKQYLRAIQSYLVTMGMSHSDAAHIKGVIKFMIPRVPLIGEGGFYAPSSRAGITFTPES